jgi:hypothetical protein
MVKSSRPNGKWQNYSQSLHLNARWRNLQIQLFELNDSYEAGTSMSLSWEEHLQKTVYEILSPGAMNKGIHITFVL